MNDSELLHLDKEVEEMMVDIKKIHEKLLENKAIEEAFDFKKCNRQRNSNEGKTLKASLAEIEKMDAILKIKATEEKEAKLCRIQAEAESQCILGNSIHCNVPKAVKLNLEEFLKLLNEMEKTDSGELTDKQETNLAEENESEEHKKRIIQQYSKTKGTTFIERNIQLAKCGRGVLSLTDEEKLRIRELLMDVEETEKSLGSKSVPDQIDQNIYKFDEESKLTLSRIDEQLEAFTQLKNLESSQSELSLLGKETGNNSTKKKEKNESLYERKLKEKGKFSRNRLREINKLLNCISSVSDEEITPLPQQGLEFLIQQAKQNFDASSAENKIIRSEENCLKNILEESNSLKLLKFTTDENILSKLVSNAKTLMPKYKYRFDDS